MTKRSQLLDRLFDEGAAAATAGEPCEYPGRRSLDRASWENGWRYARREMDRLSRVRAAAEEEADAEGQRWADAHENAPCNWWGGR